MKYLIVLLVLNLYASTTGFSAERPVVFDSEEYLDHRLTLDLDGKNFTLFVKNEGFKELEMWGDYKIFKVNLAIQESYEEMLEGKICFLIQMEAPYSDMPIYPKEFLVSFSEKESNVDCYHNDSVNIYPAGKRYFEKIERFRNSK